MFISPDDIELYAHFKSIADSEALPVILYNNPGKTNVNMSAALVERLACVDNIAGIKDSSGDMTLTSEYIRRTRDKSFNVFAGRDTLIFGTLAYGGSGAVAATANVVPGLVVSIYDRFTAGDMKMALDAQYKLAPLRIAFKLGTFPAVMKEAMKLAGVDAGIPIKPVTPLKQEDLGELKKIIGKILDC